MPTANPGFAVSLVYYTKTLFESLIRLVGPLFVVLAIGLISAVIVIHYRVIIPYYSDYFALEGLVQLVISSFLTSNIYYNYIKAIFTSPGNPPDMPNDSNQKEFERGSTAPRKGEGFSRYCKICKIAKPERSHHCHVCKRCVLKMDHHCPWVSNCVGFHNHRFFVLFLMYLWLGCAYVAIMSFIPFRMSTNMKIPWKGSPRGVIIFTFVITISICLALGFMLAWQLYLVLSGQTTIEFYYNRYMSKSHNNKGENWENPYDLGWRKNFQLFFGAGKYWFSWLLPFQRPPPGDGIVWISRSQQPLDDVKLNDHYV